MDGEGGPPWRRVAAGATLVWGLLCGAVLSLRSGWYPYSWQWVAYHTGLVALVSIFLLLPRGSGLLLDEPPDRRPSSSAASGIVFGAAIVVRRVGGKFVTERILFRSKGLREGEKREILEILHTARGSNGTGFERKAAVPNRNFPYRRFSWISVGPGTLPSGPRDPVRTGPSSQRRRP